MKGGGWPGGGGRSAKGVPGRGGRRAEAPGWEGCGRREGQRGRQCWWVGTLAGGTRGWRGPLGTGGRVPGRPLGGKAWVWRGGLSLRGPPHHCHTELPRAPQGGRSPRAFLSARPWTGGQRVWDPAGQDTVRCGGTLPFHPEAEAQEAPPSPNALENVVSVRDRGESRLPWLAGQCPLRCRPSHPERGERGALPARAVPPQPALATEPRGAGGPGVQSVWVPA